MDGDEALRRAWVLGEDGWSDAVEAEAELYLPMLIDAGYVNTGTFPNGVSHWSLSKAGVARAETLGLCFPAR
jgi:hypothetical protein